MKDFQQIFDEILSRFVVPETDSAQYEPGYRLGYTSNGKNYIYNHLKFVLQYHKDESTGTYRVVGFVIEPKSVDSSGLKIGKNYKQSEDDKQKQIFRE